MKDTTSADVTTGPAAAALVGTGLGLVALGFSQVLSERSEAIQHAMQSFGNLWMPGAAGIGPYSGKETIALLAWLLSWGVLHLVLRKREVNLVMAGLLTLVLIGVATTILWPPVTHLLVP
ncbi:MAG: hypothetical protein HYZ91_01375 [Candidatus Omnitrophica bacterium]|nr:hypothetical protein [Candidatus Omnitrophota bacterium]